jgi:hypothetical protein
LRPLAVILGLLVSCASPQRADPGNAAKSTDKLRGCLAPLARGTDALEVCWSCPACEASANPSVPPYCVGSGQPCRLSANAQDQCTVVVGPGALMTVERHAAVTFTNMECDAVPGS